MAIRGVEFSNGGYKLERFLPKNQHTQRKLLNFENWVSGKVSKIGRHFSKGPFTNYVYKKRGAGGQKN